jgi:hypothetical protein
MTLQSVAHMHHAHFSGQPLSRRAWLALYVGMALATFAFQIWWRSSQCGADCGLSYAKAVVWSVIWPASWTVFLAGIF